MLRASCAARSIWSRDISSLDGIAVDARHLYVTDDKRRRARARQVDRRVGLEAGQAREAQVGGPQIVGDYVGVVDVEGYLHLLDRNDGSAASAASRPTAAGATAQPVAVGERALWQSQAGNGVRRSARADRADGSAKGAPRIGAPGSAGAVALEVLGRRSAAGGRPRARWLARLAAPCPSSANRISVRARALRLAAPRAAGWPRRRARADR